MPVKGQATRIFYEVWDFSTNPPERISELGSTEHTISIYADDNFRSYASGIPTPGIDGACFVWSLVITAEENSGDVMYVTGRHDDDVAGTKIIIPQPRWENSPQVELTAAAQQDIAQAVHGRPTSFVDANIAASGDGLSWDTAFKTITEAVTASASGDLILIGPGTYTEAVDLTLKPGRYIRGAGINSTTITSSTVNGVTFQICSYTRLEDITLEHTGAGGRAIIDARATPEQQGGACTGLIVRNVRAISLNGSGFSAFEAFDSYFENVVGIGANEGFAVFGYENTSGASHGMNFGRNISGYVMGGTTGEAVAVDITGSWNIDGLHGMAQGGNAANNCYGIRAAMYGGTDSVIRNFTARVIHTTAAKSLGLSAVSGLFVNGLCESRGVEDSASPANAYDLHYGPKQVEQYGTRDLVLLNVEYKTVLDESGDGVQVRSLRDPAGTGNAATIQTNSTTAATQATAAAGSATSILAKIGAITGSGVNTLLGILKAILRKDATLPSDIGGTVAPATDSLEAQSEKLATVYTRTSTTPIVTRSLITQYGELQLHQGADYLDADDRAIEFANDGTWVDLTGATVHLLIRAKSNGDEVLDVTGTVVGSPTAAESIKFSPTNAQTALLTQLSPRAYEYKAQAEWALSEALPIGKVVPLVEAQDCTALW